jgi:hypothetical protein
MDAREKLPKETTEYLEGVYDLREAVFSRNDKLKNILNRLDNEFMQHEADMNRIGDMTASNMSEFMKMVEKAKDFNKRYGDEITEAVSRFNTKIGLVFEDENDPRKQKIEEFSEKIGKMIAPELLDGHMVRIISTESTGRYVSDEIIGSDSELADMFKDAFRKNLLLHGKQLSMEEFLKNMKNRKYLGLTKGYPGRSDMMLVDCSLETFAHEMGHVIENAGGKDLQNRENAIGDLLMSNRRIFGDYSMTKVGSNYTEILSTGIENLVESPVDLYVNSPMQFMFTVGVIGDK